MRNLKRALSLTLASVMLLSMMVVGSSAAAGYDDVAETDNVEAIEVLQAIEVMVGDERGFGPERPVNRAEMAVVMGKLLNLDYDYYATSCPFNDVYDWARGWVGACYANKIVSGRGDGVYDPGATVTAVEAASMLMRALGYFQYANDVADGFELATVRQGTKIGIFDQVGSSATEPMTRNQVAQMVLNALQSDVVEPDGNTINLTTPDGTVLTGKVNYVSVTRDEAWATAIDDTEATSVGSQNNGYIVELGERLYNGDLKLYDTRTTSDKFERPSRIWEYKGKEIGTYMKVENIRETYTAGVTNRTLYDLLGRTILQEYEFAYYVDGVLIEDTANTVLNRQDRTYGQTGRGVLTQVFVDIEDRTIDITSISTYLAQANVDYNKTTESISLNVYGWADRTGSSPNIVANTYTYAKPVSVTDVPEIEDLTKDQYVLVNVSGKNYTSNNKQTLNGYDVVDISDPEILSDSTLTKFSKRGSNDDTLSDNNQALFSSVVTGGTEYKSSAKAYYSDDVLELYDDDRLVNKTYNIYLDKYGYAIGIDLHEGDSNYVFITGFDPSGSYIAYGNANAAAIFADGTQAVIKVDTKATNSNIDKFDDDAGTYYEKWGGESSMKAKLYAINRWYTYTVDANNVYTLRPTRMITTEVAKAHARGANAETTSDLYTTGLTIKTNSVRIDENASWANDAYVQSTTARNDGGVNRKAAGNKAVRTYGNDDSVYIVVETGDTDYVDKSANIGKVITDVSGVYTGVQSVEIDVTTKDTTRSKISDTELYDSIYTVYDKDNYIIASVILGEAKGGNANYAYILTAAKSEEKLADDGATVWEFDAIVDGKVTTLKTNSKFNVIHDLRIGCVQELRYTADNEYVSGVKTPTEADKYYDYNEATTARIGDEAIYDVGHSFPGEGDYDETSSTVPAYFTSNTRLNSTRAPKLELAGNTLYFNRNNAGVGSPADFGLAIENKDTVPAVVIEKIDGSWETVECANVAQAIAELEDPIDTSRDKEFEGRIVAILNSQGAAKWVVFVSDTEKWTASGGTATGGTSEVVLTNTPVADVQALLSSGKNVTVPGTWNPSDAPAGSNAKARLTIPGNRTLTIQGDFVAGNASDTRVRIDGTGSLVVSDEFEMTADVSSTVDYNITAGNMLVRTLMSPAGSNMVFKGTVATNKGDLEVFGDHNLTFNRNVTVKTNLVNDSHAKTINVNATMTINGSVQASGTSGNLTFNVNSTSSLHIKGDVSTKVIINAGSSTTAGYVTVTGTLSGTLNVNKIGSQACTVGVVAASTGAVNVAAGTAAEVTTNNGTVTVTGADAEVAVTTNTGTVTVQNGASADVDTVNGASAKVEVSGTGSAATVDTVTQGTVEAKIGAAVSVGTTSGASATLKVDSTSKVEVTESMNASTNVEGAGKVDVVEEAAPSFFSADSELFFIYNEETWQKGHDLLRDGDSIMGTSWANFCGNEHGYSTLAWMYGYVKKNSAVGTVKITNVEVQLNGEPVTLYSGLEEDTEWTRENFTGEMFHWEMKKSSDPNTATLSLGLPKLTAGTYTLIITVQSGEGYVKVPFSAYYDGTVAAPPANTGA